MRLHKQNGFTMVEIVIVIGIIAAMSAVAMPMFFSRAPTWRLREAARDAYGMMMKAKGEAVTSGMNCIVEFYTTPNTKPVSIAYLDINNNLNFDPNTDTLVKQVMEWPKGIQMDSAVFNGSYSRFIFLPSAFPAVESGGFFVGGNVQFSNLKGEIKKVVLNQAGSFSIQ